MVGVRMRLLLLMTCVWVLYVLLTHSWTFALYQVSSQSASVSYIPAMQVKTSHKAGKAGTSALH